MSTVGCSGRDASTRLIGVIRLVARGRDGRFDALREPRRFGTGSLGPGSHCVGASGVGASGPVGTASGSDATAVTVWPVDRRSRHPERMSANWGCGRVDQSLFIEHMFGSWDGVAPPQQQAQSPAMTGCTRSTGMRQVVAGAVGTTGFFGSIVVATSPMIPIPPASAWPSPYAPEVRPDTRMVPATAVPSDDPRFETHRDNPEISPWRSFGETRLNDVDRRREHRPQAEADEQEPRRECPRAGRTLHEREQRRRCRPR